MHFFLALVIGSFIGVFIYRWFALKVKIIDVPNERSSHTVPTPRGGGIAVAGVWFAAISFMYFIGDTISEPLYMAFVSGMLLAIVGIMDDIWNISPKIRLVAQLSSALAALYFLGGLQKIDFGFYVFENTWLLSIVAFVAIIWFINLFNFLDGLDGYLGAEVFFISLSVGVLYNNTYVLALASVTLGFLFLNWPKAKIFMGDVGSTLLGFNIIVLAIYFQNVNFSSIFIWVLLSSLFWFDATLTLFRRFRNHEKLMEAHKKHAYQRIVQAGFSHKKTLYASILINLIVLLLTMLSIYLPHYVLVFVVINTLFLYFMDKQIGKLKPFEYDAVK